MIEIYPICTYNSYHKCIKLRKHSGTQAFPCIYFLLNYVLNDSGERFIQIPSTKNIYLNITGGLRALSRIYINQGLIPTESS